MTKIETVIEAGRFVGRCGNDAWNEHAVALAAWRRHGESVIAVDSRPLTGLWTEAMLLMSDGSRRVERFHF